MKSISWKDGWKSGIGTVWELGKIIFPITLIVGVLQHTPVIDTLIAWVSPAMSWLGLPGEAAIPLVLGNLLNLYAAIGAMLPLELKVKEVFILAVMLSFSHALPLESAVCKRAGISSLLITSVRMGLAAVSGALIHAFWNGGQETVRFSGGGPAEETVSGWGEIILSALQTAGSSILQLAVIVIPLMLGIQVMRDLGFLDRFAEWMKPLMKPLGIAPRGSVTLTSGLLIGLSFGAGVILQQTREKRFTRREITLILIFLACCHGVIEDTLIFVPLGIPVWPLLFIRLIAAILLTLIIARLWPAEPLQKPREVPNH
ncbi:hypothetical protein CHM34_11065 [Paludifilum halophilum]|uniref:Nucleoside transporter/FeoB GTPase Gate domain-containing protein n=2 Tax=Paludifilum halophilum TaxID=1642702 RepID=A0A235B5J3_9BACL|nr:nucleoside recognition domain-containing protein [Paludifilum halophilum]OYD07560.1 hypothetical protein CHM34_11065 [Paludifilum halophilum]